jgi:hypothetical protein
MSSLTDEIARRRTFAIISYPDAGKTTLTEKLLLFGGAIQARRRSEGAGRAAADALGVDGVTHQRPDFLFSRREFGLLPNDTQLACGGSGRPL